MRTEDENERSIELGYVDGHAVDMWALGPILFMLTCGFQPWHLAINSDDRFRAFSRGLLAPTLKYWASHHSTDLGLSDDLVDLLQGMFWADPRRRLSLAQVKNHRWMDGALHAP